MVIITSAYFIIFSPAAGRELEIYAYIFIAFYLMTNLIVAYIPEKYFYDDKIFYGLFYATAYCCRPEFIFPDMSGRIYTWCFFSLSR